MRCLDRPTVFTGLAQLGDQPAWHLLYNHCGGRLALPFQPGMVAMVEKTGRVYHPGPR